MSTTNQGETMAITDKNNREWKDRSVREVAAKLSTSLSELGATACTDGELHAIATVISDSMTVPTRFYHTVDHALDVASRARHPIQVVAALFHDVVYCTIDGGLTAKQRDILDGVVEEEEEQQKPTPEVASKKWKLCEWDPTVNRIETTVASIFGLSQGQELDERGGLNEFLSTVVAVRLLGDILQLENLIRIAVCVEATIPFRPVDSEGNTPIDRLYQRLVQTNKTYSCGLSQDHMIESVQLAAALANSDNGHFCSTDRPKWLNTSWTLLPEWNVGLRDEANCKLSDFHFALLKFHNMCTHTDPSCIYLSFHNVPSKEIVSTMTQKAKDSIQVALPYIGVNLLSVSIILAVAQLTGGDMKVSSFLEYKKDKGFGEGHAVNENGVVKSVDPEMYELLSWANDFNFDPINSSLAASVYYILGNQGLDKIMNNVLLYPMTNEVANKLLASLPSEVVSAFALYLEAVAPHRKDQIIELKEKYSVSVSPLVEARAQTN